jgi:hypothetical protein
MEFNDTAGDGPFHRLLGDHLHRAGRPAFVSEFFTRAAYRAEAASPAAARPRRSSRRKERRLRQAGPLEYAALEREADVAVWCEGFLRCEASGWKGRVGTAMACDEADRAYFHRVAAEAFRRDRLLMFALHHDGRPIAYRCSFRAGDGAFAFKMAYDEAYAPYSPGLLLERENRRRLEALPAVRWMDSCTAANNVMINRIYPQRRAVQPVVVSTGKRPGDLVVSLLPLLRWLKRTWLPQRRPAGDVPTEATSCVPNCPPESPRAPASPAPSRSTPWTLTRRRSAGGSTGSRS